MRDLDHLLENNQTWANKIKEQDPAFFQTLSEQQSPKYLWVGCSDSRVPANDIVGLLPGELFVHRNVANVVVHTDLNCLSVIQYAVDVLKVRHVMVVGHYGCGGVRAALEDAQLGLIDNWLRHVRDVLYAHREIVRAVPEGAARVNRLCELNVLEQAANVCATTVVQDAWARGQALTVHGWVYGLEDGLLRDLNATASNADEAPTAYKNAIEAINSRGSTSVPW